MKKIRFNLFSNSEYYSFQDLLLVVFALLISKSLYYDLLGESLLYIPFFGLLIILSYLKGMKIQKKLLIYSLFLVILILLNPNSQYSSLALLILRLAMGVMFLSLIPFKRFSYAFIDVVTFLALLSLLTIPVIFFNLSSPLPDFVHTPSTHRNFFFFGVLDQFVVYQKYRINGLWWEPGAFQVMVNLAFLFSIINKTLTTKKYLFFAIVIFAISSTTGLIIFILFSIIYFKEIIKRNGLLYIVLGVPIALYGIFFYLIPKISHKFDDTSADYGSFLARYYDTLTSFELWTENILIGYGYGAYGLIVELFAVKVFGSQVLNYIVGSDGLTTLIAQCGIFMIIFLIPLLWPKYLNQFKFSERVLVAISIFLMFNTENFSFTLLVTLLTFYGLVGNKTKYQKNISSVKKELNVKKH